MTPMLPAARRHHAADMISREHGYGKMNGQFRGCSIGCMAYEIDPNGDYDDHAAVAQHYGYPEWLAHLQDVVFEGLPASEAGDWHVQIATEIDALNARHDSPPWQRILHLTHAAILRRALPTALTAAEAVRAVVALHEAAGRGEAVSDAAWSAARSAAESAWSAAWSAARSAESAAESAARSAESVAYQGIRDDVLAILRSA